VTSGRGSLPRVEVATPLARAEVYLQGAHVTAYAPRGGPPVLFLSRASRFERGAPIRGGIPLVFPWFGRKAGDPGAPLHGPARLAEWSLDEAAADPVGIVRLRFALADVTVGAGSAHARLGYQVTIGGSLQLALEVENRGPAPFVFEDALHTYLAVADVERITLTGLEGAAYLDETEGFARKRQDPAPLVVRGETDRIYDDTRATCVVWDPVGRRRIEVAKTGSEATVVWNPSAARALPDLGADEWRCFVCVESGNVGARAVTLAPGARHRLAVALRSEPWGGA
jgi:glucose-6-phosphate 1-epimerase